MPDYSIESVRRAVRILNAVALEPDGLALTELIERVQLSKATVFRLLSTLTLDDMIEQDPKSRRYRLGVNVISLGQRALDSTDLVAIAKPLLSKLIERFPVVAYLNVATQTHVLTIERVPRMAGVQFARAGVTLPFHATASGLLFLAFGPPERVESVLAAGLTRFASGTIADPATLRRALKTVRERGYAYDRSTLDEGVGSVAVPIRDHQERLVATIGLSATVAALDEIGWEDMAREGLEIAGQVSARLGSTNE